MDMEPPQNLSQPAFPTVLPGLGAIDVTWYSNGGADSRFNYPEPFSNLENIYLSSPLVSPSLPPSARMTEDDAPSQDVPFSYSSPFFEDVS